MLARVTKFCTTASTAALFYLLFCLITGNLHTGFATGCVLISGIWLVVTSLNFERLLETYCSWISRLQVQVPLVLGLSLNLAAFCAAGYAYSNGDLKLDSGWRWLLAVAAAEMVLWSLVYWKFCQNKKLYERQKHGPLPAKVWINPDRSVMTPGTFMLTAGDLFAPKMHDAVDHAELVINDPAKPKTRYEALSSWIAHGTVINHLRRITMGVREKDSFWIALRPVTPFTEEEQQVLFDIAHQMKQENVDCISKWQPRIDWFIGMMPLPREWKDKIKARLQWDGYDYLGVIVGLRRKHTWTCFGSTLEAYFRLCKEMERRGRPRKFLRHYGSGALGIGTGIFDPLVVVRLLDEPELHLFSLDDKAAFEEPKAAGASATVAKPANAD